LLLASPADALTGLGARASRPVVAIVQDASSPGSPAQSVLETEGRGSGVFTPETTAPHDSPASAQPLPADGGVVGTLRPADVIDVYEILADPDASGLRLELDWEPVPDGVNARFLVFDESGRILVDQPLAGDSVTRVHITFGSVGDGDPDPSLFAAVLRVPESEDTPEGEGRYQLRLVRPIIPPSQAFPADFAGDVPPPPAPQFVAVTPRPSPPAERSDAETSPPPDAIPTRLPGPSAPGRIVTVPLPTGPSLPAGGVFADGGPIPEVSRRDATRVDRSLIDVRPRGDTVRGGPSEARRMIPTTRGDRNSSEPPRPPGALTPLEIVREGRSRRGLAGSASASGPGQVAGRTDPELAVRVEDVPALRPAGPDVAVAPAWTSGPDAPLGVRWPAPMPGPPSGPADRELADRAPAEIPAVGTKTDGSDEGDRRRREALRTTVLICANGWAAMAFGLLWGSDLVRSTDRPAGTGTRRRSGPAPIRARDGTARPGTV
jgi:hypothetical protein